MLERDEKKRIKHKMKLLFLKMRLFVLDNFKWQNEIIFHGGMSINKNTYVTII